MADDGSPRDTFNLTPALATPPSDLSSPAEKEIAMKIVPSAENSLLN